MHYYCIWQLLSFVYMKVSSIMFMLNVILDVQARSMGTEMYEMNTIHTN